MTGTAANPASLYRNNIHDLNLYRSRALPYPEVIPQRSFLGMTVLMYLVDAFVERPFVGNPAAICLPDTPRDAAWMQARAAELHLSETAFLQPRADGASDLRWFPPAPTGDQPEYDLISHFFAPRPGIAEDPVTGAAHCTLTPFWGECLGRTRLTGFQSSRRDGQVGVELLDNRVRLSGQDVPVHSGVLHV
jgi:predicted PhzF superfamily epimerase YddE/YHI9